MTPIISTLRVFTGPASEPITLDVTKTFLRVYTDWEDTLIQGLITAARQMVEQYLGRVLVTQTLLSTYKLNPSYTAYRNSWSTLGGWGTSGGMSGVTYNGSIELARSPLQAITSVTVRGWDGVDTIVTTNAYNLDKEVDPPRLRILWHDLATNYATVILPLQHIQIKYTAGYGGTQYQEAIPQPIIQAILLYVGHLYENRGDSAGEIPSAIYRLCDPYRLISFGGQ